MKPGRPVKQQQSPTTSSKGAKLFKATCANCHALDKVLSGPALRGVTKRGPWAENKANFKKWVRNPAAFIPTNQYTIELQKQFRMVMPAFVSLTDEEVDLLYEYLDRPSPAQSKLRVSAMK
jgi:cytochrome c2